MLDPRAAQSMRRRLLVIAGSFAWLQAFHAMPNAGTSAHPQSGGPRGARRGDTGTGQVVVGRPAWPFPRPGSSGGPVAGEVLTGGPPGGGARPPPWGGGGPGPAPP